MSTLQRPNLRRLIPAVKTSLSVAEIDNKIIILDYDQVHPKYDEVGAEKKAQHDRGPRF